MSRQGGAWGTYRDAPHHSPDAQAAGRRRIRPRVGFHAEAGSWLLPAEAIRGLRLRRAPRSIVAEFFLD